MNRWLDWRAMVLAAVLAAAAALPLVTTVSDRRDFYLFEATISSSNVGTTTVAWDLGHGFNPSEASRQPLRAEARPIRYRYLLPPGNYRGLRFTPSDRPGTLLSFTQARIVDFRGHLIQEFTPADFSVGPGNARLEISAGTVSFQTGKNPDPPALDVRLSTPLHLPVTAWVCLRAAAPIALPAFALGLLLGLPGFASGLQRRLHRLGPSLCARPKTALALAALLVTAVQSHPVIFFGRSFVSPANGSLMLYGDLPTLPGSTQAEYADGMGSDTGAMLFQHLYYPMVQREALSHGELPLWNRYSLAGTPLLGQGQSMLGDPFNLLTILADGAAWMWDVRFVLAHALLALGLGMVVWRLTAHLASALLITVSAGFLGFFTFRLVHPDNFSVCYSPWILWAWVGFLQEREARARLRWLAALMIANGCVMASGTVKEAYMLLACLNFAGVLLLLFAPLAPGQRIRRLAQATAAGGLFVLISAPLWMAFLTTLRHSYTVYENQTPSPIAVAQVIGFFDDIFYRQSSPNENIASPALNFFFLLGVAWWLAQPQRWWADRAGLAVMVAALVPFTLAFGLVPAAVVMKIPFLSGIVHTGNTFSCPLMILAAVLAGFGIRAALEQLGSSRWWRGWARAMLLGAALLGIFIAATRGQPRSDFFRGYALALIVATLVLPIGARWAKVSGRPGALYLSLALGLPLLYWRHAQYLSTRFNHYAFTPGERVDFHASSDAVKTIDRLRHEPGRVNGWGTNLFPTYNILLRWEGLYGADALRSHFYEEMAAAFDVTRVRRWDLPDEESTAAHLQPIHDLFNVTYYLADHRAEARPIGSLQLVERHDLDVYTSATAWPRAFFTDQLAAYEKLGDFVAQVRAGDGRPFASVQRSETQIPHLPANSTARAVRGATDYQLTPNATAFTIDAPGPGVVVLTESYYPDDFLVTVDGHPTPYFRVNHAFKGVAINRPGRHEITFAYWPQYFTLALLLGAAGIALAGLTAWRGLREPTAS